MGSASTLGPRSPIHVGVPLRKHHGCCDPARAALREAQKWAPACLVTRGKTGPAQPDPTPPCSPSARLSLCLSMFLHALLVRGSATLYHLGPFIVSAGVLMLLTFFRHTVDGGLPHHLACMSGSLARVRAAPVPGCSGPVGSRPMAALSLTAHLGAGGHR